MQTTIETELTRRTWQHWRSHSVKPNLTYLELHTLTLHITKTCREHNKDPQEIDLLSILDSSLNYYENLDALDVQLHQLGAVNLQDYSGWFGSGTEKLREKLLILRAAYKHMKKRLDKTKRQNAHLKQKLKKKHHKRNRKVSK